MNTSFERGDQKEEWLTPKPIIDALGPFDLDPCASVVRPWEIAATHYTIEDNGLLKPWNGFVWCNPPYGQETKKWFRRMLQHGNGIALTFARVETKMFFESVWGGGNRRFIFAGADLVFGTILCDLRHRSEQTQTVTERPDAGTNRRLARIQTKREVCNRRRGRRAVLFDCVRERSRSATSPKRTSRRLYQPQTLPSFAVNFFCPNQSGINRPHIVILPIRFSKYTRFAVTVSTVAASSKNKK